MPTTDLSARLHVLHPQQRGFVESQAKRKITKAGRRGGKTVGAAELAVNAFLAGRRVLYGTPTSEQLSRFWHEVKWSLRDCIEAGLYKVNETDHTIELPNTLNRIKAKTCWNADTLRGDYADLLILDEYQLMNEDAWEVVGQPMLLDNNGDAVFIYTPPSLLTAGVSKARDPRHAAKLFVKAQADTTGLWATFHWTSRDNPNISQDALNLIAKDMDRAAYRREILAEDDDADANRLVYSMFDERTQLLDVMPLKADWPRETWHDFGQSNPCCLFVAFDDAHNLYIYDEYLPGPGKTVFQHVEEFKRRTQGLFVRRRIGGNQTTEDEIRQGYAAHGWPIVAPTHKRPDEQISRVKGHMERNRVFVSRACVQTVDDLRNALWEQDKDGYRLDKVQHEARYHTLAAIRYGASDFQPETADTQVKLRSVSYART